MDPIFLNIKKLTLEEGQMEFLASVFPDSKFPDQQYTFISFDLQISFLKRIIKEVDELSTILEYDETILISVKNQKLLRACYQIIVSLGISQCLMPGLGVKLSKKCVSAALLPSLDFTDTQKHEMLVECTDFLSRSYNISLLKKIIITLHLSDYIAALIQLSFAPLKKPGTYDNFVMTENLYEKLTKDKEKYLQIYEHLVNNCFQPTVMRELLVLQSVKDPSPPLFVKRVISKELSRRLLAPDGLLSLTRCFMESYNIDTGFDWKKIDMISRIVATKHGSCSEASYLNIICSQLTHLLSLNNTHYLATAVTCILRLNETFPQGEPVRTLMTGIFKAFDYSYLISISSLPGTLILTPQEIEHKVNILNACTNITNLECHSSLLLPNIYVLFLLGIKCTKNDDLKFKIKDILLKCLQQLNKNETTNILKDFLFGKESSQSHSLQVEEYDSGLTIKYITRSVTYGKEEALSYFIFILKSSTKSHFVEYAFEASLEMLIEIKDKRKVNSKESVIAETDTFIPFNEINEQYITILQLLSELSATPKIVSVLKSNPTSIIQFIENLILKHKIDDDDYDHDECLNVALVLLNTILSNSKNCNVIEKKCSKLVIKLQSMSKGNGSFTSVLCEEALSLISSEKHVQIETKYSKAIADAFDELLPVRAHGLIALTKLIEAKDIETISKKHYVFCLFQEQLKDADTYIYLSAINGIASLGTHCTDDVLQVLCKEFLQNTSDCSGMNTKETENKVSELRMKIGDVIVKVTKRLGEMAIVHKTILLNTMLCGCRDDDPLIRASALSNLAEIALVLHYKMGTIIYEVLHCVWSILETDKVIECRRAAVMVVSSLIKGLGKEILIQLKDNLLPIYRALKNLYNNNDEDSVLRLHAQIALEELNDIVNQFMFPELNMEKQIFVLDKPNEIFK